VVVLDADLPNVSNQPVCRILKERCPDSRVLVLVGRESQATLVESLQAGASGYLAKGCPVSELIESTRAVARGEVRIPLHMLGELLSYLIDRPQQRARALRHVSRLTRREKEILSMLADGADNSAIARILVISGETARTHIQHILAKLGVHSRLEAAVFVRQNDILDDLVATG
jgi:DNA-binding NarL/FixJ family response regulator